MSTHAHIPTYGSNSRADWIKSWLSISLEKLQFWIQNLRIIWRPTGTLCAYVLCSQYFAKNADDSAQFFTTIIKLYVQTSLLNSRSQIVEPTYVKLTGEFIIYIYICTYTNRVQFINKLKFYSWMKQTLHADTLFRWLIVI